MKLYEIAAAYLAPLKELESSDATPEIIADTLADIKDDFDEKARNVARYIKQLAGEQSIINDEIARLQKRAAQLERKEGALREYLLYWMAETGTAEINDPVLPIAIKRNPEKLEIPVGEAVPDKWLRTSTVKVPDKPAIRAAINSGELKCNWAKIVRTKRLKIG